jgi:type I restriction enzyme R subunit
VGRGTRLFDGKHFFTIYDFVDAYQHFSDPEWDGEPLEPEPKVSVVKTPPVDYTTKKPPDDGGEKQPRPKRLKIVLADGKARDIQHMISTSFWSPDGKPISAEEFLKNLYGTLPDFFTSEAELREIWSYPMTRKTLLDKLSDAGYGKAELLAMQQLISAEHSDLFDVLEYVSFATPPVTRAQRVAHAHTRIFALLDSRQQEFLDFVLSKYLETGVEELDQEKLPHLLQLKYHALEDAKERLGEVADIRDTFVGFQKYLYESGVA